MKHLLLTVSLLLGLSARSAPAPFPTPYNLAELRSTLSLSDDACNALREQGFVVLGDRTVRSLERGVRAGALVPERSQARSPGARG